jgi:hypothetical protein
LPELAHARPACEVLAELGGAPGGLDSAQAAERLAAHEPNALPQGAAAAIGGDRIGKIGVQFFDRAVLPELLKKTPR